MIGLPTVKNFIIFLKLAAELNYFPPIGIKPGPDGSYFDDLIDISKPSENGTIPAGGSTIINTIDFYIK